jgi:hypothetical protein
LQETIISSSFLAKINGSKTIACCVLGRPARGALLARGVHGLLAGITEAELGEAIAGVVWGVIKRSARPAAIALAADLSAVGADVLASAVGGQCVFAIECGAEHRGVHKCDQRNEPKYKLHD